MDWLVDLAAWFADGEHWRGEDGVPNRVREHAQLSALAVLAATAVALPLGVLAGRRGRGGFLAGAVLNMGRAIPSFAILALSLPLSIKLGLGLGFWPTWLALFVLAMPPIFTNALTGVRSVGRDIIDAARGVGMRDSEILRRVQLPLAIPLILAGVRTAAVQVVATAPLGALVAWGGLGRYIVDGIAQRDFPQLGAGAVLVAAMAVGTELMLGAVERRATPAGIRPLVTVRRRLGRVGSRTAGVPGA